MDPIVVLLSVVAVGAGIVMVPYGVLTYFDHRMPRTVICPATGHDATVTVNAKHAALTAPLRGMPVLRARACSEWPEHGGCDAPFLRAQA